MNILDLLQGVRLVKEIMKPDPAELQAMDRAFEAVEMARSSHQKLDRRKAELATIQDIPDPVRRREVLHSWSCDLLREQIVDCRLSAAAREAHGDVSSAAQFRELRRIAEERLSDLENE